MLHLAKVGRHSWILLEMLSIHRTQRLSSSLLEEGLIKQILNAEEARKSIEDAKVFTEDVFAKLFPDEQANVSRSQLSAMRC
jgi:hypothetical protein